MPSSPSLDSGKAHDRGRTPKDYTGYRPRYPIVPDYSRPIIYTETNQSCWFVSTMETS